MKKSFLERIQSGEKLVADGSTGANLQKRGLPMGMASERWVLENPEQIIKLHTDFISAGSDIILTCTFGGSSIRLEQSGLADKAIEINTRAAELARKAAGDTIFVAGSVGPLGHLLKPLGPVEEEDAFNSYQQQIQALDAAGVDLILIETQFDLAEASIAIKAARSASKLPLVCSFSYDRGTRTMMGVKPSQTAQELSESGIDMIGINCGRSLGENLTALQMLRKSTELPIWFKPNAGSPGLDEQGKPVYSLKPEEMGAEVSSWLAEGASVVGGCCGTSPEHLAAIATAVKKSRIQ